MKRIFVITLGILILISTSSLPIVFHFCEKTGFTITDKCETCEEFELSKSSCCESENNIPFNSIINDNNHYCCESKVFDKQIDDQFLLIKFEQLTHFKNFQKVVLPDFVLVKVFETKSIPYHQHSPPLGNKNSDLIILYATLLI